MAELQTQAHICRVCHDDHSSDKPHTFWPGELAAHDDKIRAGLRAEIATKIAAYRAPYEELEVRAAFITASRIADGTWTTDPPTKPVPRTVTAEQIERALVCEWHQDQCGCLNFDGVDIDTCHTRAEVFRKIGTYAGVMVPPTTWTVEAVLSAASREAP